MGTPGVDLHHIKTRAGGGTDDYWNLLPLCHEMHQKVHTIGLFRFAEKYPTVKVWLKENGWIIDPVLLRWTNTRGKK